MPRLLLLHGAKLTIHTVRPSFPSWTYCRPALRPRLLQADPVYCQVSTRGFILHKLQSSDYELETSVVLVGATVVTAECVEFWQLLLCQGLLTGAACGMAFSPVPAIASQWFRRRRSLAFGIIAAGSSAGGTVVPIAASRLIELVGHVRPLCVRWAWLTVFSGSNGQCELLLSSNSSCSRLPTW